MFQKEIVMGQPKWLIAKTKIQKKTLYGPSPNQLINRSNNHVPTIHAPLIDLGQNRWWPQLGILRNYAQPMKLHDASNGPLLGRVGARGVKPLLFSRYSHQVLIVFPSRKQWVPNIFLNIFPKSTSLRTICFAHCCPLGTYMLGQILILSFSFTFGVNTSILGSILSFRTCLWWAN
jgi:hypothetical protein